MATTYDFYKSQSSRRLYYNQELIVNDEGVTIEVSGNSIPWATKKGVWFVYGRNHGTTTYVPEGDPRLSENGDLNMGDGIVWKADSVVRWNRETMLNQEEL